MDRCKNDSAKAMFFVRKILQNNWSRAVLENFLDTDLYDRQGKAISNFSYSLPVPQSDLAQEMTRTEEYIDLLFYHLYLHCYVVVEVKVKAFRPSDISQTATYVAIVDDLVKRDGDNKTIGLIICKSKNNVLAQYAVGTSKEPIGIRAI